MVIDLFQFLSSEVDPSRALEMEDELFLVLVQLWLGLLVGDLAHLFGITKASVVRIFQKWPEVMYHHLGFLIK